LLVGIGEYFISTIATLFILIILLLDFMIKKWLK